jgi:DNA-binding NarL/FixJ family response regulator
MRWGMDDPQRRAGEQGWARQTMSACYGGLFSSQENSDTPRVGERRRLMMIKVLVVDDHAFIRAALVEMLEETDDIHVVGTCADGSEVAATAARTAPDVVLMDVQMPKMSGLEATRELLVAQPAVRVLVMSGDVARGSAEEALALGVAGFLLKEDHPGDLPQRIRTVAAGGSAWSEAAAARLHLNN